MRLSMVPAMNTSPPAVAMEPPCPKAPVLWIPLASSSSVVPRGTRQAMSPVFAFTAISSAHGGGDGTALPEGPCVMDSLGLQFVGRAEGNAPGYVTRVCVYRHQLSPRRWRWNRLARRPLCYGFPWPPVRRSCRGERARLCHPCLRLPPSAQPTAVAMEPPCPKAPVLWIPLASSSSVVPRGTRQAMSPVFAFTAISSAHGGCDGTALPEGPCVMDSLGLQFVGRAEGNAPGYVTRVCVYRHQLSPRRL